MFISGTRLSSIESQPKKVVVVVVVVVVAVFVVVLVVVLIVIFHGQRNLTLKGVVASYQAALGKE